MADVYVRDTADEHHDPCEPQSLGTRPQRPELDPAISGDGRHVVFVSEASNLTRDRGRHVASVYIARRRHRRDRTRES